MNNLSKQAILFVEAFDAAVEKFCVEGADFNISKLMNQFKMKKKDIPFVQNNIAKQAQELVDALNKSDEQVVEAYSFLTKSKLRVLSEKFEFIMNLTKSEQKIKKVVSGESFNAVFAICKKYNVIRCFIGNVQLDGNKVSASESYVMTFKAKIKVEEAMGKDLNGMMEFIAQGKKSPRPVNTISGNTVDAVIKF